MRSGISSLFPTSDSNAILGLQTPHLFVIHMVRARTAEEAHGFAKMLGR
jgi:hypothetical protein